MATTDPRIDAYVEAKAAFARPILMTLQAARARIWNGVVEAKSPETRATRIAQAVAWMADGSCRDCKYERC